jgi:branched-chain amino acid transport system permease protein
VLDFPIFTLWATRFPAYKAFMMLVSVGMFVFLYLVLRRTRVGLIIQASLTHPSMVAMLGHNVPQVFTRVFAAGTGLAALAGVIGGFALLTAPNMAAALGPIVFVVVVIGGLGSLSGALIASLGIGIIQTFSVALDVSAVDLLRHAGVAVSEQSIFHELLSIKIAQAAPMIPYLLLVLMLIFRPKGLLGTRET